MTKIRTKRCHLWDGKERANFNFWLRGTNYLPYFSIRSVAHRMVCKIISNGDTLFVATIGDIGFLCLPDLIAGYFWRQKKMDVIKQAWTKIGFSWCPFFVFVFSQTIAYISNIAWYVHSTSIVLNENSSENQFFFLSSFNSELNYIYLLWIICSTAL